MNIPSGKLLIGAKKTNWENFINDILSFYDKGFIGYFVVTGMTDYSSEEGVFIFDEGKIVAAAYEILTNNHEIFGDAAIPLVFNLAAIKTGVYEVYELKKPQVQLLLSQNKDCVLSTPLSKKDIEKQPKHKEYDPSYVKKILKYVRPKFIERVKFLNELGISEFKVEDFKLDNHLRDLGDWKWYIYSVQGEEVLEKLQW